MPVHAAAQGNAAASRTPSAGALAALTARSGPTGGPSAIAAPVGHTAGGPAKGLGTRPATQAPTSRPDPGRVFQSQLTRGLAAALKRGSGDVTIRLRPQALGDLKVSLRVQDTGVEARFEASTHQAHRLLEQSVGVLRAALEARGLHASKIEILPPPDGTGTADGSAGREDDAEAGGFLDGEENRRSTHGSRAMPATGGGAAGGTDDAGDASETALSPDGPEGAGVVYGVADGAARVLRVDALA